MNFDAFSFDDLLRLASRGAGLEINAGPWTADQLARLASAAAGGRAHLRIKGLGAVGIRPIDDLLRIASAGKGSVFFVSD